MDDIVQRLIFHQRFKTSLSAVRRLQQIILGFSFLLFVTIAFSVFETNKLEDKLLTLPEIKPSEYAGAKEIYQVYFSTEDSVSTLRNFEQWTNNLSGFYIFAFVAYSNAGEIEEIEGVAGEMLEQLLLLQEYFSVSHVRLISLKAKFENGVVFENLAKEELLSLLDILKFEAVHGETFAPLVERMRSFVSLVDKASASNPVVFEKVLRFLSADQLSDEELNHSIKMVTEIFDALKSLEQPELMCEFVSNQALRFFPQGCLTEEGLEKLLQNVALMSTPNLNLLAKERAKTVKAIEHVSKERKLRLPLIEIPLPMKWMQYGALLFLLVFGRQYLQSRKNLFNLSQKIGDFPENANIVDGVRSDYWFFGSSRLANERFFLVLLSPVLVTVGGDWWANKELSILSIVVVAVAILCALIFSKLIHDFRV